MPFHSLYVLANFTTTPYAHFTSLKIRTVGKLFCTCYIRVQFFLCSMLHLTVIFYCVCILYSSYAVTHSLHSSSSILHYFLYTNTTTSWSHLNSELLCRLIFAILVASILLSQVFTSAIRIRSIS